jgi:hypothetical protein
MKYCWLLLLLLPHLVNAQFTETDSLRGGINKNRSWWDVQHYDITLTTNSPTESVIGQTDISFNVIKDELPITTGDEITMQIDLWKPLEINQVYIQPIIKDEAAIKPFKISESKIVRKNRCYEITVPRKFINISGATELKIMYSGQPQKARHAPWDGGMIWTTDANNKPWISVACQGYGASMWYPCKDHQSDEPNLGATTTFIIPDTLNAIGNGKRISDTTYNEKRHITYKVTQPINNYNIVFYIGDYQTTSTQYKGKNGMLTCTYSLLKQNSKQTAYMQEQVYNTLLAFEDWFGPYPFYEDGYQIVEAPFLGMEHQSAVAYGNGYKFGYKGKDLSGTGYGKKWDYIVVHESGHEWWGNNITTADIADMWVHEGFTTYSEALFVEYFYGKDAGAKYVKGLRKAISGKLPLIANYDVNDQPSGDIYYAGANLLHAIRTMLNDDMKFKNMLKALQIKFGKTTCTSVEVENFISEFTGLNLAAFFQQYLYTNQVPILNYKFINKNKVKLFWSNCIPEFEMGMTIPTSKKTTTNIWFKNNEPIIIDLDCKKKVFLKNLSTDYLIQYQPS